MKSARRFLIVVAAVATSMATVTAAFGAPPGDFCDRKPDHPNCTTTTTTSPTGSVELTIEQNLDWVHESGDLIIYTFSGTNGSAEPISVADDLTGFTAVVPAGGSFGPVSGHYFLALSDVQDGYVINALEATGQSGVVAEQSVSSEFTPYEECDFSQTITTWACIWKPDLPGNWILEVDPTPVARSTGVNGIQVTLRDHIPGNWCTEGVNAKWRMGDPPITTTFSIPEWEGAPPGSPICPVGGAGGDFFNVGTPGSFYLVVSGDVTVTLDTP